MRRIALILAHWPAFAAADGRQPLHPDPMRAALDTRAWTYADGAAQVFHASGQTLYNTGSYRCGDWRVRGDMVQGDAARIIDAVMKTGDRTHAS